VYIIKKKFIVCPLYPDFRYRKLIRPQIPSVYAAEERTKVSTPAKGCLSRSVLLLR
jgi:hypothetical protein